MAQVNPGYQAVEGDPNQLPRGEATRLNESTDVEAPAPLDITTGADEAAPPVAEVEEEPLGPDDLADAADFNPEGYVPLDEDEEYLVGPTMRPDEDQAVGAQYPTPLSNRLRLNLPALQAAASEPGASPELIALVALLLRLEG